MLDPRFATAFVVHQDVREPLRVCQLPVQGLTRKLSPQVTALDLFGGPEQLEIAAMGAPEGLLRTHA